MGFQDLRISACIGNSDPWSGLWCQIGKNYLLKTRRLSSIASRAVKMKYSLGYPHPKRIVLLVSCSFWETFLVGGVVMHM